MAKSFLTLTAICFSLIVATISDWFHVAVVGEGEGAADEPIGPVAVELIGVMPLTTAARGSEKGRFCRLG